MVFVALESGVRAAELPGASAGGDRALGELERNKAGMGQLAAWATRRLGAWLASSDGRSGAPSRTRRRRTPARGVEESMGLAAAAICPCKLGSGGYWVG
nr:unnamed protein product [Digitaria exilis]